MYERKTYAIAFTGVIVAVIATVIAFKQYQLSKQTETIHEALNEKNISGLLQFAQDINLVDIPAKLTT